MVMRRTQVKLSSYLIHISESINECSHLLTCARIIIPLYVHVMCPVVDVLLVVPHEASVHNSRFPFIDAWLHSNVKVSKPCA